jgi:drug/metabolite transporter (DMT)-like permease
MGFVLGFFLFSGYVVQTIGCKYTTAGKNAFLTIIYVIFVPFLHWLISRKRLNKYNLLAAILALIGIALLSLQGDLSVNIGDALTLLCGLLFSFQIIYIDKYTETEDPILLTVLQIMVAAVFSWILAPIVDGNITNIIFNRQSVVSMFYLGIFSTMIAFLIQNICQKFTHPATASILLSMESVFGVLCSVIFLGEVLTIKMIFGCIIMFGAITLSQTKGSEGA